MAPSLERWSCLHRKMLLMPPNREVNNIMLLTLFATSRSQKSGNFQTSQGISCWIRRGSRNSSTRHRNRSLYRQVYMYIYIEKPMYDFVTWCGVIPRRIGTGRDPFQVYSHSHRWLFGMDLRGHWSGKQNFQITLKCRKIIFLCQVRMTFPLITSYLG